MTPEQRKRLEWRARDEVGDPGDEDIRDVLAELDDAHKAFQMSQDREYATACELADVLAARGKAEAESARLRGIIQRAAAWLDSRAQKAGGLYYFDVQFFDLALDDLRTSALSSTQSAPAGESPEPFFPECEPDDE
jgi:hypothetical protein